MFVGQELVLWVVLLLKALTHDRGDALLVLLLNGQFSVFRTDLNSFALGIMELAEIPQSDGAHLTILVGNLEVIGSGKERIVATDLARAQWIR